MTVYEQTWHILQTVLANHRYEDFSRLRLEADDESNHAVLCVYIHAPNSYKGQPGSRVDRHTRHEFLVPCATYDYENWQRWVFDRLVSISRHEVGEWFQETDPLACPHCGSREEGDHTCPCPARDAECTEHGPVWYRRVYPPHHGDGEDPYVTWTTITDADERAELAPGEHL